MSTTETMGGRPPAERIRRESLGMNAAAVTCARLLVPVLNIALVASIARLGGVAALGRYTVLVTLFAILENLKSAGLTSLLVRDVAAGEKNSLLQYSSLVRIGLWGACLCLPLMVVISSTSAGFNLSEALVAGVLGLGLFPSAYVLANDALFLALGRASLSTGIALGENLLRLGGSLLAVYVFHAGILWLVIAYATTRLLAAVTGGLLLRRYLGLDLPPVSAPVTRTMIRQAPDFLTIFVSPIILFKMDVVLLDFLKGDLAVGIYGAAMRLISVCLILPDGFMTASFASLSMLARAKDSRPFRHLIEGTMNVLGFGLALLAACGTLFGGAALRLLYGPRFDAAVPVLQILVWALVPFAINRALGDGLVARGHQRKLAMIVLTSTFAGLALYGLLIPRFSYIGAAWAFNLSILVFTLLSLWYACGRFDVARAGAPIRTIALYFAGAGCALLPDSPLKACLLAGVAVVAGLALIFSVRSLWTARRNHEFHSQPAYC